MKVSRPTTALTLIAVATGLLISVASAAAADPRWTLTGSQVPGEADRPVWSIAVSPIHTSVVLIATQGHGLLRSIDGGTTWTPVMPAVAGAWVVRFDAQVPSTAYAGTQTAGFFKSTDEGKTWSAATQGLPNDVRAIDSVAGTIVVGTAQGVFYSSDAAVSWHPLGLSTLSIAAVAILPRAGGVSIFAGADNSTGVTGYLAKSEDLSGTWAVLKGNLPADATVAALAVASAPSGGSDRPVLAGTSQGLFRSDDRGVTWSLLNGMPMTDVNAVLFNPANPDQIYAGSDGDLGNGGVFRSLDRGGSWSQVAGGLPTRPRVTALALQAVNPAQVMAATWSPTANQAALYHVPDPSASLAGVTPTLAPSSSVRVGPTPHSSAPAPAGARPLSAQPAYQTYALAGGILLLLVIAVAARRWRARREDRRIYDP